MTVVALASAKGSPGVTTTAHALALAWDRAVVLVEADPDGGDLAPRLGLPLDAGVSALAAHARRRGGAHGVLAAAPRLSPLATVVPGPTGAEEALFALRRWDDIATALAAADSDVIIDLGRLSPVSAASGLLAHTDLVVLVGRPRLEDISHLAPRVGALVEANARVVVVVVGTGPYPPAEIAEVLGVPVLPPLPCDPRGANAMSRGDQPRARARTPLACAARTVAEAIDACVERRGPHQPPANHALARLAGHVERAGPPDDQDHATGPDRVPQGNREATAPAIEASSPAPTWRSGDGPERGLAAIEHSGPTLTAHQPILTDSEVGP